MVKQNTRKLTSIAINVCGWCNLDCEYCFYPKKNRKRMSKTVAEDTIDFIKKNVNLQGSVSFFGIEPTLNWGMVKFIMKKLPGYRFDMTTNATRITKGIAKEIARKHMGVLVSWDGQPGCHNPYRSNSYDETLRGITHLNDEKILPGIAAVVLPQTMFYMKENFMHMSTVAKIQYVHFNIVQPWSNDNSSGMSWPLMMLEQEFIRLYKYVLTSDVPEGFMAKWLEWRKKDKRLSRVCGAGKTTLGINYDGRLYPCHRTTHWGLSIGDVWSGVIEKPLGACNRCEMCTVRFCQMCWVNPPNSEMCKVIHVRERVLESFYQKLVKEHGRKTNQD
ncbi:radical SAM protein [Candidatus Pacearchaeota archaeon]|nr:radical SAM protein [Candidatus Pacearchaeota archaeon]